MCGGVHGACVWVHVYICVVSFFQCLSSVLSNACVNEYICHSYRGQAFPLQCVNHHTDKIGLVC